MQMSQNNLVVSYDHVAGFAARETRARPNRFLQLAAR